MRGRTGWRAAPRRGSAHQVHGRDPALSLWSTNPLGESSPCFVAIGSWQIRFARAHRWANWRSLTPARSAVCCTT